MLPRLRGEGVTHAFCALGSNGLRQRVGGQLISLGFQLPAIIGPAAFVSESVRVGSGVAILPGAVVNADATIGNFAIINTNAGVDHDAVIGLASHIGPGAALAGCVRVGDRAFIATGTSVIPGREIGQDTVVGAGSVVVHDLPDKVIAYGNPARAHRKIENEA